MTDKELHDWADSHTRGVMVSSVALAVKQRLEELDRLRMIVAEMQLRDQRHGERE